MKQTIACVEYAAKVRVIIVFQIYIEQETEKLNKIWEILFVQFSLHIYLAYENLEQQAEKIFWWDWL